jgi:hypothetical protein
MFHRVSFPSRKTAEMLDSPQTPRLNLILPFLPLLQQMEDEIRKVEAQIEEISETVRGLLVLKKADKAKFDSDQEEELQYWIKKEEALRKEKEDLRKEKLLLLEISKNESESKLIYSLQ